MSVIDEELRLRLSSTEAVIPAVAEDMANPPWRDATARILIVRLSPLKVVEGSSSHLVLFSECRRALPQAFLDFAFFPDARDRALLASKKASFFFGLESGNEASAFDLILVSNSFALELINLSFLFSTGLQARASERSAVAADAAGKEPPIIVLGGSNAAAAGAVLFPGAAGEEASDALVDGIFFGEGEARGGGSEALELGAIGELSRILAQPGETRANRLRRATEVEGFWAALSGKPAERKALRPYPSHLTGYPVLNTSGAATARLQISAGCPGFCSFCLEGWESRPYREYPVAAIAEAARELKAKTGASALEIYSYNFNTHGGVFELMSELNRVFRKVNFMSQRLDVLADSPFLATAEFAADKRSFTLGIEGISERMRRYYRKGVDARQVDAALTRLTVPAARELKLFYIIAGIEDDSDLAEFAEFAATAAERRRRAAPGQRIIASVGYLVRLPFTPLQYAPLCLDRDRLETIARRLEGACAAAGLEFRLAADFEEYYVDQVLVLGGRKLAPWLERTANAGLHYDGALARGAAASLEAFAEASRLSNERFFAEKDEAWRPPLAFSDGNHEALWSNYRLATSFAPKAGALESPKPPPAWESGFEKLMSAKRSFASLLVRVEFPASLQLAGEEYRSAWIQRTIAAASSGGGRVVFDAEDALFAKGEILEGMADRFWGAAFFRLRGPDPIRMEKAAAAAGMESVAALPACDRITVELEAPPEHSREAEAALRSWLAASNVNFVEESRDGIRLLSPAVRDLKKKVLFEAEIFKNGREAEAAFKARLVLGPKADLRGLLSLMDRPAARSVSLRFVGYDASSATPR